MKENDPFSMNCSGYAHDTHLFYIQRWLFIIQYSTDITMIKEAAGGPGVDMLRSVQVFSALPALIRAVIG